MASPVLPENPPQLTRFPQHVRDAFARFRTSGDVAAAQVVVSAALVDFLPRSSVGTDVPADGLRLMEDLGYDSLAIAEIVFFFEDLFGVKIESNDLRGIATVGDLRTFVGRQIETSRDAS